MSSDHQQFAQTVLDAFKAAGHYTDQQVSDAGGPSSTTMTTLRKVASGEVAHMRPPRSDTLRKIDQAAEWWANGARRLWETGQTPPPGRSSSVFRDVKPDEWPTPEQVRAERRRVMSDRHALDSADTDEVLLNQTLTRLHDRILEAEERIDLLEDRVAELSEPPTRTGVALAADEQEQSIAGEQESQDTP